MVQSLLKKAADVDVQGVVSLVNFTNEEFSQNIKFLLTLPSPNVNSLKFNITVPIT